MKLTFILYQIVFLVFLFDISYSIKPRRRILENLGRIYDALHELGKELPPPNERYGNRPGRGPPTNEFDQPFRHALRSFNPPPNHRPFDHPPPNHRPFDHPPPHHPPPHHPPPDHPPPHHPPPDYPPQDSYSERPMNFGRGNGWGRRPHPSRDVWNTNNPQNSFNRPSETAPPFYESNYSENNNANNNNYLNYESSSDQQPFRNNQFKTRKPNNDYPQTTRKPNIANSTDVYEETPGTNNKPVKHKLLENAEKICGLRSAPRIVGGREAKPNSWIWMAALIKNDDLKNYCGGVLITGYHILTASHCLQGQTPQDMFVRLGDYDFKRDGSTTSADYEVEYFIIHPKYDKYTHENDLAILKIKQQAQFTHFIRPICLPKKRRDYTNEIATVIGYGTSTKLREVSLPIWKHEKCEEAYSSNFLTGQLCAGFKEGGNDSCQGDSGGPLMLQGNRQKYEVIGIVSYGIGCGQRNYPGVYTKVGYYLDWIISNIN